MTIAGIAGDNQNSFAATTFSATATGSGPILMSWNVAWSLYAIKPWDRGREHCTIDPQVFKPPSMIEMSSLPCQLGRTVILVRIRKMSSSPIKMVRKGWRKKNEAPEESAHKANPPKDAPKRFFKNQEDEKNWETEGFNKEIG